MRKRTTFIAGSLTIIVLLGYIGIHYANSPADGVVTGTEQPAPTEKLVTPSPQTIDGTYASFTLPNTFTKSKLEPSPYPTVETFGYDYRQAQSSRWTVTISINNVSSNNGQSTSYQLRASKPQQYISDTVTVNNKTYVVMTDTARDVFSKVAYSSHDQYVADISVEGGEVSQKEQLQAVLDEILASWQWH